MSDDLSRELWAQLDVARLCLAYAEEATGAQHAACLLDTAFGAIDLIDFGPPSAATERVARLEVAQAVIEAKARTTALLVASVRPWLTRGGCC